MLIAAALLAFAWANSPWAGSYYAMLKVRLGVGSAASRLEKPLQLWVNDLLMAVFFFLVGLEIKREVLVGELAGWRRAALPVAGALGGMVVPALIYVACNLGSPALPRLGRADGDRHRVRARRAGAAGQARAAGAQGVPAGAGDRRRPGRGARDRAVLHRPVERRRARCSRRCVFGAALAYGRYGGARPLGLRRARPRARGTSCCSPACTRPSRACCWRSRCRCSTGSSPEQLQHELAAADRARAARSSRSRS